MRESTVIEYRCFFVFFSMIKYQAPENFIFQRIWQLKDKDERVLLTGSDGLMSTSKELVSY